MIIFNFFKKIFAISLQISSIVTISFITTNCKNISIYSFTGGSDYLSGTFGNSGKDYKRWYIKTNNNDNYNGYIDWAIFPTIPGVSIDNGVVSWDSMVERGIHLFRIVAIVKNKRYASEDFVELYISHPYISIQPTIDSSFEIKNFAGNNPNLQYSFDTENWNEYSGVINIPKDKILYLKGNNPTGWSHSDADWHNPRIRYTTFKFSGEVYVAGSVMALVDNGVGNTTIIPDGYCFSYLFSGCNNVKIINREFLKKPTTLTENCYGAMFSGCSSITIAPDLPAISLKERCYNYMFNGCSSLQIPPILPATSLVDKCYQYMFENCTSLKNAPNLPATELADGCYTSMFANCTSLKNAPNLPAISLKESCYNNMFSGCSSLQIPPILPATELAEYCYNYMFNGCDSLTFAPELPATILVNYCYYSMFSHCTSLTIAPDLLATSLIKGCYTNMFKGCESLKQIKLYYDGNYDETYFKNWVNGVNEDGIFYYNGNDTKEHFGLSSWTLKIF